MEESFKDYNKNNKGKRSVNYIISESKEKRKVLTVEIVKYSDKIVKIDKFWVLWYEKQGPRGRKAKSSILTVINKASGNYFNNNCMKNKVSKSKKGNLENLGKIRVKNIKLSAVEYFGAHSKKRPKTKESNKNNPDLIRIFQAYPAYIRGLGLLRKSPQIGYFRLLLPKLGSLGYLRDIIAIYLPK